MRQEAKGNEEIQQVAAWILSHFRTYLLIANILPP